jgi:hypothetical protein
MGLGSLEPTFETLVDSFVFLDKNKDGYVSKNEMIQAINETIGGERSSGRIGMKRFGKFSFLWYRHKSHMNTVHTDNDGPNTLFWWSQRKWIGTRMER